MSVHPVPYVKVRAHILIIHNLSPFKNFILLLKYDCVVSFVGKKFQNTR